MWHPDIHTHGHIHAHGRENITLSIPGISCDPILRAWLRNVHVLLYLVAWVYCVAQCMWVLTATRSMTTQPLGVLADMHSWGNRWKLRMRTETWVYNSVFQRQQGVCYVLGRFFFEYCKISIINKEKE